ncbi:serine hydrolase family protein [Candidatus Uhrbacteria bacterium]|nr:serine hydrolase family protein [Candidatus Uhrbacteria bacterium]
MRTRVIIVHGWGGFPEEGWFPWLKQTLEQKGYTVEVPHMPHPDSPEIFPWVSTLAQVVGDIDEHTFFVGHSIGCQTILRFLESLPAGQTAAGAVFVAPWLALQHLGEEEMEIAKPWLQTQIDLVKVLEHLPKSAAIFSDNDPFVSIEQQDIFRDELHSEIVIEHRLGHMSGEDGVSELPSVLVHLISLFPLESSS